MGSFADTHFYFVRHRWRSLIPSLDIIATGNDKSKFDCVEFYLELATFLYQEGH